MIYNYWSTIISIISTRDSAMGSTKSTAGDWAFEAFYNSLDKKAISTLFLLQLKEVWKGKL